MEQTRTKSLFVSLGERERRLDSIEARAVTWEGAKENSDWQISYHRDVHSATEACSSFFHGNGTEL